MDTKRLLKWSAALAVVLILSSSLHSSSKAQRDDTDLALAQQFAPVLYFHPAEVFRPQSVDVILNTARLSQARRNWIDINILTQVSLSDLLVYTDPSYALDAWYGDEGSSDYKNYSAHRDYYENVLSPEAGGPAITAYARVTRSGDGSNVTIQYWLFYYYNDWFNKHEGDWEMIEVILDEANSPEWVVLSQHHGGTRRSWTQTLIEDETHPAVYVALGSHANYFWGPENYPNGTTVGSLNIEVMDRTGDFGRIIPEVVQLPGRDELTSDPAAWAGLEWLQFKGRWGQAAPHLDFGGPLGPADKGRQWEAAYEWGLDQPLDVDTWYQNRFRIELSGQGSPLAQVLVRETGAAAESTLEQVGAATLLHSEVDFEGAPSVEIIGLGRERVDLLAVWPDRENQRVHHYAFRNLQELEGQSLFLAFSETGVPRLFNSDGDVLASADQIDTLPAIWDAPDLVWIGEILPFPDLMRGLSIIFFAGAFPALVYVTLLYRSDRYEKDPRRLLAAAVFWGALPALVVALLVQVFFDLPADLLGPEAIEAVRAGLVAPVIEESFKGLAVLYIARRYRREFDNVLDGIIYGASAGMGYAMTANILSYLGAFVLKGYAGLDTTLFLEGLIYGLNSAFYTAVFGAGLGFARLRQDRFGRVGIPVLSFLGAVLLNGLHKWFLRSATGVNLTILVLTLAGLIVLVVAIGWSLRRQRNCIRDELRDELPSRLYLTFVMPGARAHLHWQSWQRGGWRAWRSARRFYTLGVELAFKKMQYRLFPEEIEIGAEAKGLRKELAILSDHIATFL